MNSPLRLSIPHQLGRVEARRRIENGFSTFAGQLPGGAKVRDQRWDGDRLTFSVEAMMQTVSGSVEVLDTDVTLDLQLPGLLGQIAGAFKERLQRPVSCC
ncbi:polyhydroxyalkanoic acid system family protein [Aquabacterium sp. J223]|uniref:polyhydroxyalkanoic acid system family protein n=1 Tax=Aquabacterium sp. J223 TaxID=2898431 RepID=UPI0021AE2F3D|nr:polyhydroxyalkanoic acid system family protein [Aquabacterium sp. J223]UUX95932.1 polyhydroxyalkanoic acid system family protein [Aquabacterium sp. J223]